MILFLSIFIIMYCNLDTWILTLLEIMISELDERELINPILQIYIYMIEYDREIAQHIAIFLMHLIIQIKQEHITKERIRAISRISIRKVIAYKASNAVITKQTSSIQYTKAVHSHSVHRCIASHITRHNATHIPIHTTSRIPKCDHSIHNHTLTPQLKKLQFISISAHILYPSVCHSKKMHRQYVKYMNIDSALFRCSKSCNYTSLSLRSALNKCTNQFINLASSMYIIAIILDIAIAIALTISSTLEEIAIEEIYELSSCSAYQVFTTLCQVF